MKSGDSILVYICQCLSSNQHTLQHLTEGIHAVRNRFQKHNGTVASDDGITAFVVEQFVMEFLKEHLKDFKAHQTSVSDFVYRDTKFAFRVISGKSDLHLERPNKQLASPSYKHFSWKNPILLLNLKSEALGHNASINDDHGDDESANLVFNQGFYVLNQADIGIKLPAKDTFKRNVLTDDDDLCSCLCEAVDKKLFVALPAALGLKKFTLSRGLQWK